MDDLERLLRKDKHVINIIPAEDWPDLDIDFSQFEDPESAAERINTYITLLKSHYIKFSLDDYEWYQTVHEKYERQGISKEELWKFIRHDRADINTITTLVYSFWDLGERTKYIGEKRKEFYAAVGKIKEWYRDNVDGSIRTGLRCHFGEGWEVTEDETKLIVHLGTGGGYGFESESPIYGLSDEGKNDVISDLKRRVYDVLKILVKE